MHQNGWLEVFFSLDSSTIYYNASRVKHALRPFKMLLIWELITKYWIVFNIRCQCPMNLIDLHLQNQIVSCKIGGETNINIKCMQDTKLCTMCVTCHWHWIDDNQNRVVKRKLLLLLLLLWNLMQESFASLWTREDRHLLWKNNNIINTIQ